MKDTIRHGSKRNFFMVDNGVFDERLNLGPLDMLVYICLLRYADNNTRQTFTGQERIASDIGISRQRVNQAISLLVERGLIEKKKRFDKKGYQTSNEYIVYDANEVINRVSPQMTPGVTSDDSRVSPQMTPGVTSDDTNNTALRILYEKESFPLFEQDKNNALINFRELKRLVQGENGSGGDGIG